LIGSFGDARFHIQHVAAVDDMIAVRWELAATHDGGALYGRATGEPVYILAVTHWRIEHNVIVDEVTVFDEVALMRQMEGGL
jgi:predicted ester cyclase